jgi:sucrose-phosphate synthase
MHDWCLITDIDGTLLGESASARALREAMLSERRALAARGGRLHWVIATGRRFDSAREVLLEEGFRVDDFDAWITSVGAELYHSGEDVPSSVYASHLGGTGFRRSLVLEALRGLEFLRLQPDHEQFEHKVSYYTQDTPEHRQRLQRALASLPFETRTVFAHDEYLDIAPHRGTKGGAVSHLLDLWQLPRERAVAAGDSGNDAHMLEQDWHGIVVGNGRQQLAHLEERSNVYFANGKHAAGVLEGLLELGFLARSV